MTGTQSRRTLTCPSKTACREERLSILTKNDALSSSSSPNSPTSFNQITVTLWPQPQDWSTFRQRPRLLQMMDIVQICVGCWFWGRSTRDGHVAGDVTGINNKISPRCSSDSIVWLVTDGLGGFRHLGRFGLVSGLLDLLHS